MSLLPPALVRATRWAAVGLVGAQTAVAAGLVVADGVRKLRHPPRELARRGPRSARVADSEMTVYTNGADLYTAMLAAIRHARRSVYFETYIWKDDAGGRAVKDALVAAARRGVETFVVYDEFANLVVPRSFFRFPAVPALHVLRFPVLRPGLLTLDPRKTGRDHRKLLVVDGETGFVGGYNIGSRYARTWRDTHLRVQGPQAWELENAFVDFWNRMRRRDQPPIPDTGSRSWDGRVRAAQNAPHRMLFPVRGLYLDAIDRAQSHLYLTQGYLIPDREILDALVASAQRGVDVRILLPERSNHVIADWVSRSYWSELLDAGVRLFLYESSMVHAKTATIDGRWTTIGSANIDRLSLIGNFEVNLEVYDTDLAAIMEEVFATDLLGARELTIEHWEHRGRLARGVERLMRPLRPLL